MSIKGITNEEEKIITSILKPYREKYNFYYYGSRVKGDYRFLSDLDIMVKGNDIALSEDLSKIKEEFDKSNLSYIVNLSDFYNLDENFFKLIEKDLITVNL